MANLNTIFAMEPLRSLAFGSIVAGYTGIGLPTSNPALQFIVQNNTNELLVFSIDGAEDHIKLPAGGYWDSDVLTNSQVNRSVLVPTGTRFYVKRVGIPTTGTVDVSICYAR